MSKLQKIAREVNFMIRRLESARVTINDAWKLIYKLSPTLSPVRKQFTGIPLMKRRLKLEYQDFKRRTSGQK